MPRPRVLLLTPYSPFREHQHAAADLAAPFMRALAARVDLHVVAPDTRLRGEASLDGVTLHLHPVPIPSGPVSRWARLGWYPYALRNEWRRQYTLHSRDVLAKVRPQVLHSEYLQPIEALRGATSRQLATSLTMHDLTARVFESLRHDVTGHRRVLAEWEYWRIRKLEEVTAAQLSHLFVFSERDRGVLPSGPSSHVVRIGVDAGRLPTWDPVRRGRMIFSGAMWREPNARSAVQIAREVLPRVRATIPEAELIIAGADPLPEVLALKSLPGVSITGRVADLDQLVATADVALATAEVQAGVLLKALKAMAIGVPTILNGHSAAPLPGISSGLHAAIAESYGDVAAHAVRIMQDRDLSHRLSTHGRQYVLRDFNWDQCADSYVNAWMNAGTPKVHAN